MRPQTNTLKTRRAGFTLTELMVSSALAALVLAAVFAVLWMAISQGYSTELFMRVSNEASQILERMTYGSQGAGGLREADGATVVSGANGWTLTYRDADDATNAYLYSRSAGTITYLPGSLVVCSNVVSAEAATNAAGDGVSLGVSLQKAEGRFCWSNAMNTFVQFRNRQQK